MVKRVLYMLVFLAIGLAMRAQQNYFFTHYSSEDGLSQNTVMSMVQDYKGNLWFGTWDGLNRFNGYSFKTYKARQSNFISLTNNRVDYLYEDIYGCLWLFTYDNRAHRFDPRTETFEQVPAAGQAGSSSNVLAIQVLSNGVVWLLTDGDGAIRVVTNPKNNKWTAEIYSAKLGLLSGSRVYAVHQDFAGNEWLLTNNGLGFIRKGEKTAISYFAEKNGMHTHSNQSFYTVEESQNELFFGSDRGRVWRYQKKNGQFQLLELSTSSPIASVKCVSPTKVVIATATDGFFTYNLATKEGVHYSHATCANLSRNPILSAYIDKTGEVWFEQEDPGVVAHFNPTTQVLKREQIKVEPTNTDRSHPAFHIHEDSNGVLWVHPYGGGFSYFDRAKNALVPFYDEIGSADWKFSNKVHSTFSDKQGNLWICTHSKGLEKVTFRSVQFSMLTPTTSAHQSLSNEVRALCQDRDNNIWVGLKDGLLRVYDKNLHYKGFLTEQGNVSTTGTPMVGTTYFIKQDSKGTLWIATKGNGLVRAQPTNSGTLTYKLTRYRHNDNDIYSLSDNNVYCVHQDNNGRIWVATFAGGINYLSKDTQGRDVFINHHNNLKGYPIDLCYKSRFITSDKEGHLWVGTTAGAISFNENFEKPEDIVFHHYARIPNQPKSLSNNDVHWIVATKKNELFLATFGGGLNKLMSVDKEGNGVFKSYSVLDGLPSDVLLSMREDQKENLWISTENGISKFIPSQETFENYDDRSITFPVRFSEAASAFTSKGDLLFGASSGVFMFHPDSIRKSNYIPPIVFSNLIIGNQTVIPGEKSILKEALDDTKELKLSHDENIFAIQFAALDYTNPMNIQYEYMLEGFEKEWTYADKQRSVTYTNLSKGRYTFKVRSTNSDGVWVDNMRMLNIVVLPSFWETPLAYFLYILCVVLFIFVAVYILFTIYRLKHEVSVEQQVSDIKLRFFTNISHELRTPLTLIAGPVEHVLRNSQLPHDVRQQLVVVERNTNRMLRLVNQILDFRKIQNKKMKMQVQRVNVVAFVRKIMENFDSLAEEHTFDFLLETENEELYLWVDADKLEKIVFNLLSNAFKYTPNGKLISVFIREDEDTISIGVQDQGIGIAEKNKKSLFVRFESLVDINLFNQASTGIGLSLVKELVEMHKATITVDSKLGEGSCFRVKFFKGKDHYDNTVEFMIEDVVVFGGMEQVGSISNVAQSPQDRAKLTPEDDLSAKELMLLVEDNQELRFFLRSVFSKTYRVVEAVDGVEGWNKALKFLPDIIISDVMMPVKDGILLTKELRQEVTTSHIPIVLLTAKTALESKLEGLEYGADDYITKPFSATYLKARVENLLTQRKTLQRLYRDTLMSNTATTPDAAPPQEVGNNQPLVPEMSPIDRRFMDKLLELMEANMDNGELVVDDLVCEIAVSRSVFFKKLKTLTGLAPIEFIKEMRIKRATQLIESREFNMTQISYMVGINDPRYFSKCFKAKLGMTPTEYRDKMVGK